MKRKLMVGMNHRFRPDTMLLKSFIEGKELGKLFYAKTAWLRRRSSDSSWVDPEGEIRAAASSSTWGS